MGVIVTLLPNAKHVQRLRTAIRDRHELIVCESWSSLVETCGRQPVRMAFIDLFAGGQPNFDRIRYLKERLPRLTIVAYVEFTADRAYDLFDAGRQGIDGLVLADQHDSPRALLALVEQAESRSLGAIVRKSMEGVDATARDALLLAVTRAHERLSPEGLARLLALPRRTVSGRLRRAGFPSAQRLLTWGRLIVAAHLLEDAHRSADRISRSLEFPSGGAFRNTCQRYLRASPHEIRARGGAAYVIRTMLSQIQTPAVRVAETTTRARRGRHLSLAI
ncbi:MAG TPA: helix-turn-helix domain-containing protein [Gemmatimonadaceae bacterium]